MEWISIKDRLPKSTWECVLVTHNGLVSVAFYIKNPKKYGCLEYDEDDEDNPECGGIKEPHWHFLVEAPFNNGKECFGDLHYEDITHWMPLPNPPDK